MNQKDKQRILDMFCKDLSKDYGDQLVLDDEPDTLFDKIQEKVANDFNDV